jgi:hypothetical protein
MPPLFWFRLACTIIALAGVRTARGREYVVDMNDRKASDEGPGTPELPLKSLARGAQLAKAGDTVVVKPGLHRERVLVSNSGTPTAPIAFVADPPGSAVITGADLITGWQRVPGEVPVYRVPWEHRFVMAVKQGQEIEHYPYSLGEPESPDEPRWGRAEQVLADRRHLIPVRSLDELAASWKDLRGTSPRSIDELGVIPDPKNPATWAGAFFADTTGKALYVCLRDGVDPNARRMEAGTRLITFGTDRWHYVHDVHVRGFIFRYGATLAGWGICCLDGSDNRVEDCLIEEASQNGILIKGAMRRCVVRNCGHVGGGAQGKNFLNEACLWEGNNWKPVRGWDSGGFKLGFSDQGVFRRCLFRRNHAQGLWLDCHVRNVLITECVFEGNWESGLFIEISRDIYVMRNLFIGNANVPGTEHDWGDAGIKLGESMNTDRPSR